MQTTRTQQIHADFKSALNMSAVKATEIIIAQEPVYMDFLGQVGLHNSKTYEKERVKANNKQTAEQTKNIINQLIEVEAKYPQYRIISLGKVVKLMAKYNLCFGSLGDYISVIPKANIEELERYEREVAQKVGENYHNVKDLVRNEPTHRGAKCYFIAAPRNLFKADLLNIDGFLVNNAKAPKFKLQMGSPKIDTDPIVLKPLNISGPDRFMHIATAWDIEAEDEDVTNKINISVKGN